MKKKLTIQKASRAKSRTRLRIAQGEPDFAALKSVIDGWLVPVLVEEFLKTFPAPGGTEVISEKPTSGLQVREARELTRVQLDYAE